MAGLTLYKCVICGKDYIKRGQNQRACSKKCGWALAKQTCMERYGVKVPSMTIESVRKQKQSMKSSWREVKGQGINDVLKGNTSESRKIALSTFKKLLDSVNADYVEDVEICDWKYDFKTGSTLICIDDTFNHNEFVLDWIPRYHLNATRNGNEHGYDVVHVFDWDDPIRVAMMFQPKTTIHADDCDIGEVDKLTRNSFLAAYHVNGHLQNNGITYGLYYNNMLVQILAIGNPRFNKKCSHEVYRLCSDPEFEVIGGSKKLFDYFIYKQSPDAVIAYCDRAKLPRSLFTDAGMVFERHNETATIWSKGIDHKSDSVVTKVGYDALFGTSYGKTNNKQLMLNAGWLPVNDCGQTVYMYRKEDK